MTTLYIRNASDMPHAAGSRWTQARCGVSLAGAKQISDKQALVFLDDRRCIGCFPNWTAHNIHFHGRSAAA